MRLRGALLGLCLWGTLAPRAAHGQADDWSLERRVPRSVRSPTRSLVPSELHVRLERAFLADPGSEHALAQLRSWELEHSGSLAEVLTRVRALHAARPHDARTRQALGRLLIATGAHDEGLALLAEAGREGATLRAHALAELGRHDEAATQWLALGRTAGAPSLQASALREAAREQLAAGTPDAALSTLKEARARGGAAFALELTALEREAQRAGGHLRELADALAKQGAFVEAAGVREELGDAQGAIEAYRARLRRAEDRAARAALVRLYAGAGQLEAARREAAQLVRRTPVAPDDLVRWAELEREAGARELALARLATEARARPRDSALQRALRTLYLRWGEQALAEERLKVLVALEPREPEPRLLLADRALARGERALALRTLQEGFGGASAAAEANLARVLGERDLLPEAVEQVERAVQRAPRVLEYRRLRASLLERAGRTQDAERAYGELIEDADPAARAEAREHLASLWRRAGTARLHAAALEAALRERFDVETARSLLALYAREPEQRLRKAQLLEQLLAHVPDDAAALAAREQEQLEHGETAAALQTRLRLLGTPAASAALARGALELALQYPRLDAVTPLVTRALSLAPRDAELQRMAGDVYGRRAEPALARAAYERALALDPSELAARNALAEDAAGAHDAVRLEALLRPTLQSAPEGPALASAVQMLLQHDGDRAEPLLLATLTGPGRATTLRLLLQHYARTLLPRLREPEVLRASVERALPALLSALASGSAADQRVALSLLTAVPLAAAASPLLALAEREDVGARERALALLALAGVADAGAAARLQALYESSGRALRPFALWALVRSAPREARAVRLAALAASDTALRGLSALLSSDALDALRPLEHAAEPSVRAAAAWTLARAEPAAHEPTLATLWAEGRVAALVASGPRSPLVVRALFADAPSRALAGQVLTHEPVAFALPAPSWPFQLDAYLDEVARASLRHPATPVYVERWSDIEQAARTAPVEALSVTHDGLAPAALLEAGACVPPALAESLASALAPVLASAGAQRPAALDLLVASGGAGRPEVLELLQHGDVAHRRALVRSLAAAPSLPPALRIRLASLVHASDWPTRMWAARALSVGGAQLAREPLALVRAQALRGPARHEDACYGASN